MILKTEDTHHLRLRVGRTVCGNHNFYLVSPMNLLRSQVRRAATVSAAKSQSPAPCPAPSPGCPPWASSCAPRIAPATRSAGSPLQQLPSPSPSPRELILSGGKAAPPATEPPRSISAPRAPPPLPERGPHSRARRPRRPLCACGLPPCCTPVDFAPHAAVWHPRLLQVLIPRPDSQFPCDPASWPPSAPRTSQAMSNPKPGTRVWRPPQLGGVGAPLSRTQGLLQQEGSFRH